MRSLPNCESDGVEKTWKLMIVAIIIWSQTASEGAHTALEVDLRSKISRKGRVDSGRFNAGLMQVSSFIKNARELNGNRTWLV